MTTSRLHSLSIRIEAWLASLALSHARAVVALVVLSVLALSPGLFSLQPMDRDEPRFAQATKQMLETGDFVDIRFQQEARHKKPVGIYWLQSAAVGAADLLGVADARRTIGLYRIPSWLAAIGSVLLTYWAALAFLSRRGSIVAAGLMGATVLLGVEARLAKTDATLLATCLVGFGVLARLWFATVASHVSAPLNPRLIWGFWLAMALGVLVKGPITPLIVFLPALVLSIRERSWRWLLPLRPWLGLAIVLVVVAPWLIAIAVKSGGGFFAESVGKDMLAKVGTGMERHWGPPGLYATLFWVTAWPMAVFMALAFRFGWKERRDDSVVFLIAWILPTWILFEAFQTKLPHYVLPLYPAIAVLAILAIERDGVPFEWRSAKWAAAFAMLVPVGIFIAATAGFWHLDRNLPFLALPFIAAAMALAFFATRALQQALPMAGAALLMLSSVLLSIGVYPLAAPDLQAVNLSRRLADAVKTLPCADPKLMTSGYNEPSLVFLTDTQLKMGPGEMAALHMQEAGCRVAFVESRQEAAFQKGIEAGDFRPALRTRIKGVNINSGRALDIGVYLRDK